MSDHQYLSFPQWQGSSSGLSLYYGAKLLETKLQKCFSFTEVPVSTKVEEEIPDKGIRRKSSIQHQFCKVKSILQKDAPKSVFTLGGDCGIELAPISYLNNIHEKLTVLWFDAHGDLNTPETSPSGAFHGMPLRTLLGEGDSEFTQNLFSILKPEQVILVGVRSLDREERKYIERSGMRKVFIPNMEFSFRELTDLIDSGAISRNLYIHFDLDFIDPCDITGVPCPENDGMSFDTSINLIEELKLRYNVVGGSICEYNGNSEAEVNKIIKLAEELFQ